MAINLDKLNEKKKECSAAIMAAIKSQDESQIETALSGYSQYLGEAIGAEANECNASAMDSVILASRGIRQMTKDENTFYSQLIAASKAPDPKQAITNITAPFPVTIIDATIEDIRKTHRLLELVNLRNTSYASKYIYNKTAKPTIAWGELNSAITNEISGSLGVIDTTLCKLSAFMYVPKDVLDLGAAWVDRFVRELLGEYLAAGLEDTIVDGTGKNRYIGMTRDVSSSASVVDGVYPTKTAVTLDKLTAKKLGAILATVATDENGEARKVENPIFVVNPFDYFNKVMPATTIRAADGTYRNDVLPYPCEIVQSAALTTGYAVIGIPSKYLATIGLGKSGKIEYDDSYKFAEDLRTYIAKLFGNGRPIDNNAFVLCDISDLEPADLEVVIKNTASNPVPMNEIEATLKSLTIGNLTLSPTFAAGTKSYTASTTAATNAITAVANDAEATITIKNGTTTVTNGSAATWATGDNTVTITVVNGTDTEVYTVVVTKS